MKPSEIYKEAFSKAFSVAIKELSNYNCNNLADTMLFSEYMLNRTCSLGDGRVMSRREFYNSVDELPEECKADYNTYQRTTKAIAENLFDFCKLIIYGVAVNKGFLSNPLNTSVIL